MALAADLQTMITNWSAALVADSISPQPSYHIDNKEVKQQEWRDALLKNIQTANQTINMVSPYIITTKCVL